MLLALTIPCLLMRRLLCEDVLCERTLVLGETEARGGIGRDKLPPVDALYLSIGELLLVVSERLDGESSVSAIEG